jgi:hypothetical protein
MHYHGARLKSWSTCVPCSVARGCLGARSVSSHGVWHGLSSPVLASGSGSGMRAVSSLHHAIGFGCTRSMFSTVDPLPKGACTVSFKFHLFARRLVSLNCIGIRWGNLLSFATTKDGNSVYFDLNNEAFDIPAPGGYSSGWHQVTVSFDSATGVVQAYFNGQLGVNRTGFKIGKSMAATLGPGLFLFFAAPTRAGQLVALVALT